MIRGLVKVIPNSSIGYQSHLDWVANRVAPAGGARGGSHWQSWMTLRYGGTLGARNGPVSLLVLSSSINSAERFHAVIFRN